MTDSVSPSKITGLLAGAGWKFAGDDGEANVRWAGECPSAVVDWTTFERRLANEDTMPILLFLLDEVASPFAVLGASPVGRDPLSAKEAAEQLARLTESRFVVLTNGNRHYLWDLHRSEPRSVSDFPTVHWLQHRHKQLTDIPSGIAHINVLAQLSAHNRDVSQTKMDEHVGNLKVFGTALSILYRISTCSEECMGGTHIIEALLGRVYNLGCSAYILACRGFYDESLNLVRSIGEISNLMALFSLKEGTFQEWVVADEKTRWDRFRPGKVREALAEFDAIRTYADGDWYSRFCREFTHINPDVKPNAHNSHGMVYAGGFVQEDGLKTAVEELTNLCAIITIIACKSMGQDDMCREIIETVKQYEALQSTDHA